jgi:hypothetical protein
MHQLRSYSAATGAGATLLLAAIAVALAFGPSLPHNDWPLPGAWDPGTAAIADEGESEAGSAADQRTASADPPRDGGDRRGGGAGDSAGGAGGAGGDGGDGGAAGSAGRSSGGGGGSGSGSPGVSGGPGGSGGSGGEIGRAHV